MNIGTVIKRIRMSQGLSQEKLCEMVDRRFSSGHLSRIETGDISDPSIYMINGIAKALKTTVDALIIEAEGGPRAELTPEQLIKIPVIDWQFASECLRSGRTDYLPGRNGWIVAPRPKVPKGTLALQIEGDSMESTSGGMSFPSGSYILVRPTGKSEIDSFVLVYNENDDELSLKQLVSHGSKQKLKTLNPRYSIDSVDEKIKILGEAFDMVIHINEPELT